MTLVVLDRDGVINAESSAYIKTPAEWRPIPGSLEALARLTALGFTVVVCTNQSGLQRGLFDRAGLSRIHAKMDAAVRAEGGVISGVFVCPHGPDSTCRCRKPRPGLLEAVGDWFDVTLTDVPVVGDSARDLAAAQAAGARPILVETGNGRHTLGNPRWAAAEHYVNLAAVADQLAKEVARGKG